MKSTGRTMGAESTRTTFRALFESILLYAANRGAAALHDRHVARSLPIYDLMHFNVRRSRFNNGEELGTKDRSRVGSSMSGSKYAQASCYNKNSNDYFCHMLKYSHA